MAILAVGEEVERAIVWYRHLCLMSSRETMMYEKCCKRNLEELKERRRADSHIARLWLFRPLLKLSSPQMQLHGFLPRLAGPLH